MPDLLKKIKDVSSFIEDRRLDAKLPYDINEIKAAIIETSNVDSIDFIPFNDPENPIWGRYERYDKHCGAYQPPTTQVDVHYKKGLNLCWTRFVVCKEMCQGLEEDSSRVSTQDDLRMLVDALLSPQEQSSLPFFKPFFSESLAQFAALELLCPLHRRKEVLERRKQQELSDMAVATDFKIPLVYTKLIFTSKYVDLVEEMFSAIK